MTGLKDLIKVDLKDWLAQIEKDKEILIAAEGAGGMRWERKVANEARIKIRAALLLAEEGLKKMESTYSTTTPGSHTASAPIKSGTKREPVSLPKFVGNEKPGNIPFLDFLVWLENWKQHISDYEEKSRSNLLLSHLDKEAIKRIAGMENDYNGAMKKLTDYFGDRRKII